MFNDAGLGISWENKLRWSFNFYFDWKPKDWIKIVSDSWFHLLTQMTQVVSMSMIQVHHDLT